MLKLARSATAVLVAAVLVAASAVPALADGIGNVDCQQNPSAAECSVDVGVPGGPGGPGNGGNGGSNDNVSGGGSGDGDDSGQSCFYERVDPQPQPPAGAGEGAWYAQICLFGDGGSSRSLPVWMGTAPQVDLDELARSARARLRLPVPAIRTNPDTERADVLVTVPVWFWVDDSSWGSRSATASVPGVSVTATATPEKVVWQLGDGTSITCGQGVAWAAGTDPRKASPACGHVYDLPAPVTLTLTATVTWTVTWAGGGRSGTVPNLVTTATTSVHVAEAPAINTGLR